MELNAEMITKSQFIRKYKDTTKRMLSMYFRDLKDQDLENIVNYSISKRFINEPVSIYNSYKNIQVDQTLLELTDYIISREPIVTMDGVLFKKHADAPNPLVNVVLKFLAKRSQDKDMMFTFPKGSELFERFNLLQLLDKRDGNAVYGVLGLITSFFYDIHVGPTVTAQGRALVSAAALQFEMFLANNVKFNNLDEVITFIDHVVSERPERKYNDMLILDRFISPNECFAKIICTCGYFWIPNDEECEIIYRIIVNLSQEDINRLYYKNNLYEFMYNITANNMLIEILNTLTVPFVAPGKVPNEIKPILEEFTSLLMEYVYYHWQIPDRISRMNTMIKSVLLISDTDSTIISVDAWYRYCLEKVKGMDFKMLHVSTPVHMIDPNEFDEAVTQPVKFIDNELDFDFYNDKIIERERYLNPIDIFSQDNLRYSIINIISYVLDRIINDYMIRFTKETHSYAPDKPCKIIMKNEYLMKRILLLMVKKNYADILELQEGHKVSENAELSITGIQSIKKSVTPKKTREALTRILYEDILKAPEIDQMKVVRHLAVLERQIKDAIYDGDKSYYKPAKVQAISNYKDPMRQQSIKSMTAWNGIKNNDLIGFNLDESNYIDIAKVIINKNTAEYIKDEYPDIYNNIIGFLNTNQFYKGNIDSIAIPKSIEVPKWLLPFIDLKEVVNNNISGFPLEAIGISRKGNNAVNYTNVIKL